MLTANEAYRRVPTGPDTASRLHPYHSPAPRPPRPKDRGRHQSVGCLVSPLNRPDSNSKIIDTYPHPPGAKTKWYAPQYKDRYSALTTGRGVSPLNRQTHNRNYDTRPPAATTRGFSPQYKNSPKNRYRRYSPGNRQQFNKVSPLNRPAKDTIQIQHPRPNSKFCKVSYGGKSSENYSSLPDLPLSRTQGEINKILQVKPGDFVHYRSSSSDDEGYESAGDGEKLQLQLQFPIPRRGRRRRGRDRKIVEVHLVRSLARLTLKSTSETQLAVVAARDTSVTRKVIYANPEQKVDLLLPRKRKREELLSPVCYKQRKIDESVAVVCLEKSTTEAGSKNDVLTSMSETDVIQAIDLCLKSMAKVKDDVPPTTKQTEKAVNVSRRQRRQWRRNGGKSSNTAESRRHISRVDEDSLDLSC